MAFEDHTADWQPIRKFAESDGNFTEPSIRHYVKHAGKFGLHPAIIRAGNKILISPTRWYACFAEYTERTVERERQRRRVA